MSEHPTPRSRNGMLLPLAVGIVMAGILGWVSLALDARAREAALMAEDVRSLREQVSDLGGKPIVPAPEERLGDGTALVPSVITSRGPAGRDGTDGTDGRDGVDGARGAIGPVGLPGPGGPPGANGTEGAPGLGGLGGPGGPAGPPGPAGADGAAGAAGPAGPAGAPGVDGAPGEPPVRWTYSDPDGGTFTCARVEPFDPFVPVYTCAPDPPAQIG